MKQYREKKMLFTTIEIQICPIQPCGKSNLHILIQYIIFIILGGFFKGINSHTACIRKHDDFITLITHILYLQECTNCDAVRL